MIPYLKNKRRLTVVISLALLLTAFFCFLGIKQNFLEEGLLENKGGQPPLNYAELENAVLESEENYYGSLSKDGGADEPENNAANVSVEGELPKILSIPKLGVSANVQHVGLNSMGEMGVPSNGSAVAWFNLGTKPGEIGSAVIAGHLDDRNGRPAVFWNVHKLEIGDDIYVISGDNNKKRFRVIFLEKYETGAAPVEKIFGANDGIYLNLVTCGGAWDRAENNYTERLVVFTEYSETE